MSTRLRAVYANGVFVPVSKDVKLNVPENVEVEITVGDPYILPPTVTDPTERAKIIRELLERMKANPIPANAPRFTREELHERR